MQTNFTEEQLSRPEIACCDEELRACLQCDYCISNCPTYQVLGNEFDTPRGRVFLIKGMLENGGKPEAETVRHLDQCLSCLACMSTCPSSVHFMHLMDHAREHIEEHYQRPLLDRLQRWALAQILPNPKRFRIAMRLAQFSRPFASVMPQRMRAMVNITPLHLPPPESESQPGVFNAQGKRKKRVALLTGCAQTALNSDINEATIRILRRHGCEVVVPAEAGCCGAVTHHMGKTSHSLAAAAENIRAWMKEVRGQGLDAIVVNTSGCGTVIKDYGHMFRNQELAEDAATISGLTKDISELLCEMDLNFTYRPGMRVVYHATCSLQFGQRIRYKPKKLLKSAGFSVLEPKDAHVCCGAAGTYNLIQPKISKLLKSRKIEALVQTEPEAIAMGNIACMMQIGSATNLPVLHTVELLDWASGGPMPRKLAESLKTAI